MALDPSKFFGSGGDQNRAIDHSELLSSGYNPHEDIDKFIEELHDKATRYVTTAKTEVLNLPNQSNLAWTDLDLSSYTTPNTYAVNLIIDIRDSGSAANNTNLQVGKNGASAWELLAKGGHINDLLMYANDIISCDENQIVEYLIVASGAGTADIKINLLGYCEYIYKKFKE